MTIKADVLKAMAPQEGERLVSALDTLAGLVLLANERFRLMQIEQVLCEKPAKDAEMDD
jgi:hypothetical protein